MFGIIGTAISFGVVAPLTYLLNENGMFAITFDKTPLYFTIKEILLFSAVISATDTVSALTFIKEKSQPKLFAILFGEGVLNDAVCIVIYRIMSKFNFSNEGI
jgi:sodium/hydrogen exchanger-like protein 6/7